MHRDVEDASRARSPGIGLPPRVAALREAHERPVHGIGEPLRGRRSGDKIHPRTGQAVEHEGDVDAVAGVVGSSACQEKR